MAGNSTMKRVLLHSAAAAALAAGLSACGGGGGGDRESGGGTETPPQSSRLEDQFGVNFGAAFRTAANSDPRDPAPGDLIAVSFTTDPVNIP